MCISFSFVGFQAILIISEKSHDFSSLKWYAAIGGGISAIACCCFGDIL